MQPRHQILAAAVVDMAVVTYRGFKGGAPTRLPPPSEYPVIMLGYGILWTLADSTTFGPAAVVMGWLLVLAALLGTNVGGMGKLIAPTSTKASTTPPAPKAPATTQT